MMEINKIVAGLCGSVLVFLLVNWGANGVFGLGEGGHSGEVQNAYAIEVPESGDTEPEEPEAPFDIATLMPTADAAAGEKVFEKCKTCHSLDAGVNKNGPSLAGLIGRVQGSADGYSYSGGFADLDDNWTEQSVSEFLTNPGDYVPGTKMNLKVAKPKDRANLIAYLAANQ